MLAECGSLLGGGHHGVNTNYTDEAPQWRRPAPVPLQHSELELDWPLACARELPAEQGIPWRWIILTWFCKVFQCEAATLISKKNVKNKLISDTLWYITNSVNNYSVHFLL